MTDKEKAKVYDETLKKASIAYKDEDRHLKATLERIFPELKESYDEKMRNFIINELACLRATDEKGSDRYEELTNAIGWLEKQGKDSTDKIEPRFKVGDWIVFIKSKSIYQVEKKENYKYTLRHILGGSFCLSFSNEDLIRKWTIQDAMDGDVLVHNSFMFDDFIFIYNNTSILQAYCYYSSEKNKFIIENREHPCPWNMQEVTPATKEQRDTLMKAMNNTGYEWDVENKELKKKRKNRRIKL